jgi:hypothetical protein
MVAPHPGVECWKTKKPILFKVTLEIWYKKRCPYIPVPYHMANAAGCLRNVLVRRGACGPQMVNWTQRQPGRAVAVARPLVCVSGHAAGGRKRN